MTVDWTRAEVTELVAQLVKVSNRLLDLTDKNCILATNNAELAEHLVRIQEQRDSVYHENIKLIKYNADLFDENQNLKQEILALSEPKKGT